VEQGDIVVATKPYSGGEPIIKRVIATGGQTVNINFDLGVVFVDGEMIEETYVNTPTNVSYDMEFPVTVPEGSVFCLGDNRNHSYDSRATEIGMIDERYILGKVLLRVFPFGSFGNPSR
jgi:signal peptidase I